MMNVQLFSLPLCVSLIAWRASRFYEKWIYPWALSSMAYFDNLSDLAIFLGLDSKKLSYIAYRIPSNQKYEHYIIKKRNGTNRDLFSPKQPLKNYQIKIKSVLDAIHTPSAICHAYTSKRSIVTNANVHRGAKWLLKIDLQDFFPSIHFGRIRGALVAPPYEFDPRAARYIAHLCTYDKTLPQGAPTSPSISNIICKGLDLKLIRLAIKHECRVTRYADDIIFSTTHSKFPPQIAEKNGTSTILSQELTQMINSYGFKLNTSKTRLYTPAEKHMVTGLVVNKKVNVTKDFYRSLRSLIYNFEKLGKEETQLRYFNGADKKYRPPFAMPDIENVITGKLIFLRSVIGHRNARYTRLANQFTKKSKRFKLNLNKSYKASQREIILFCEGKTDPALLKKYHDYWKSKNDHTDLNILFDKSVGLDGDKNLIDKLKKNVNVQQSKLSVYIFDADNNSIISGLAHAPGTWKKWSESVYSYILSRPDHLNPSHTRFCIEMLSTVEDIKNVFHNGRRLYLFDEFHENGVNKKNPNLKSSNIRTEKNADSFSLIYDQGVNSWHDDGYGNLLKYSHALSKAQYAQSINIESLSDDSKKSTHKVFNSIREILRDHFSKE